MLSAYPAGQTPPDPFLVCARAVLHGVAVYDIDPTSYVRDGIVTQNDADWACSIRPFIAAERSAAGAVETDIVGRVSEQVDVRLGLISA